MNTLEAVALLQRVPGEPQEVIEQSRLLIQLYQFEAALAVLRLVSESPHVTAMRRVCYEHWAIWALETGDLASAEWASTQMLRDDESAWNAHAVLGEIASLLGNDMVALQRFNAALNLLPRDYAANAEQQLEINRLLYLRVSTLARLRRYGEALQHWQSTIERDDRNADLWYLGALCMVQLQRSDEALPLCQRALSLDDAHIDAGKLKRQLESTRPR